MERWRWLPADLGEPPCHREHPGIPPAARRPGPAVIHQTKVIVGKAETPTPIFSDEMETVIVNPSWTVPPSILSKEFSARAGERSVLRGTARLSGFPPRQPDLVQQPPGERNALGYIKFIFPNQHAVYLHDTPSRNLFSRRAAGLQPRLRARRPALPAGRRDPRAREPLESERSCAGSSARASATSACARRLPVHLTYFTLTRRRQTGSLQTFDDLYGFNRKVKAALGLDGGADGLERCRCSLPLAARSRRRRRAVRAHGGAAPTLTLRSGRRRGRANTLPSHAARRVRTTVFRTSLNRG